MKELRAINKEEKIINCLSGWTASAQMMKEEIKDADAFLLRLNTTERRLWVMPFGKDKYSDALEMLASYERALSSLSSESIVLVRVNNLKALEKAYPNYYADTSAFINEVVRLFSET